MVSILKNPSANAGCTRDVGFIPESGRPPGEECGNPPSIFVWRIPRTKEPGRL